MAHVIAVNVQCRVLGVCMRVGVKAYVFLEEPSLAELTFENGRRIN